jgi:hypothetical protein
MERQNQSKPESLDSQLLFAGLAIATHRDPNSLMATRLGWVRAIAIDCLSCALL